MEKGEEREGRKKREGGRRGKEKRYRERGRREINTCSCSTMSQFHPSSCLVLLASLLVCTALPFLSPVRAHVPRKP